LSVPGGHGILTCSRTSLQKVGIPPLFVFYTQVTICKIRELGLSASGKREYGNRMKSEFVLAINEIIEVRALPREVILDALRTALVSAYRRDVSVSSAQHVDAEVDMESGTVTLLVEKEAVTSVQDPRTEIKLEEALQVDPEAELGETLLVPVADTTRKFGRIAAQTAKQVILQKIREAERESLYEEYVDREGDLISGTVQSVTAQGVTISLGRAEALLPRAHMMSGERYRPHDKVRTFLLEVKKGNRGPQIIVSRSHRNMLRRLLEYEVPEIYNGQVEIKNIAREAGYRSKVAVAALQEGVDPVGACVGMRGIRIQNIVRELNEEKIDVIEWSPDAATFITKALSPARVSGVYLDEYADSGRGGLGTATVVVPDDQLSLAIGREGQNARLAAKLTGWRIDIKSITESAANAIANTESESLVELNSSNVELTEEVTRILAKRETGRPVMPEEFTTVTRYARMAEEALLEERRSVNKEYQDYLQSIRDTFSPVAFETEINALTLPAPFIRALGNRFDSIGDLMLYLQVNEDRVAKALRRLNQEDAVDQVRAAIDAIDFDAIVAEAEAEAEEAAAEAEAAEEAEAEVEVETPEAAGEAEQAEAVEAEAPEAVEESEEAALPAFADEDDEGEVLPAFVEPEPAPEPEPVKAPKPKRQPKPEPVAEEKPAPTPRPAFSEDENLEELEEQRRSKRSKSKRRQLVYDEDAGKVIAKRKRKSSRKRSSSYLDDLDEIDDDLEDML
jgi:N utilization substance protein A